MKKQMKDLKERNEISDNTNLEDRHFKSLKGGKGTITEYIEESCNILKDNEAGFDLLLNKVIGKIQTPLSNFESA